MDHRNYKRKIGASLVLMILISNSACRTTSKNSSDVFITNGLPVDSREFQAVAMLVMDDGSCTGTFVSDHQVLTAAHCVQGSKTIKVGEKKTFSTLFGYQTIATATSWHLHPLYRTDEDSRYDLAVIEFPKETSKIFIRLKAVPPQQSEPVTLVGYGHDSIRDKMLNGELVQTGKDFKRQGRNVIEVIENGTIRFQGVLSDREAVVRGLAVGQRSLPAQGDSGGPLFNTSQILIGVASTAEIYSDPSGKITNYSSIYCDLSSDTSQQFLVSHGLLNRAQ